MSLGGRPSGTPPGLAALFALTGAKVDERETPLGMLWTPTPTPTPTPPWWLSGRARR